MVSDMAADNTSQTTPVQIIHPIGVEQHYMKKTCIICTGVV